MDYLFSIGWLFIILAIVVVGIKTVNEGQISVVTIFGRYQRILHPGINFTIPGLEQVNITVSTQNRSLEQSFQAITVDQANVYFKTMIVYSVLNADPLTIRKVAFKFRSEEEFIMALTRSVEGVIRSYVASRMQASILGLRKDLINYVKVEIDKTLEDWGYHVADAQITDITFDAAVLRSMEQRVAAMNIRAAAMELSEVGLNYDALQFDKWMEAIKDFARDGKGNMIFLDGSPDNMQRTQRQLMGIMNQNNTP